MSDMTLHTIALERQPVLLDRKIIGREIEIRALNSSTILQLLSGPNCPTALNVQEILSRYDRFSLRNSGPGQWLAVNDKILLADQLHTLAAELKAMFDLDCIDQSHGRARILMKGKAVRDVLAKGTAVDLDHTRFPLGSSTMTLIGHIGANLARVDEDSFELMPLRGFAENLWHDLSIMARAFI